MALIEGNSKRLTLGRHSLLIVLAALCICIVVGLVVLVYKWPFSQRQATAALRQEIGPSIRIGAFHTTLWPPGYIAENIILSGSTPESGVPELTIRKLVVAASPFDLLLLRKRVESVVISGVRFTLPSGTAAGHHPSPPRFSEIGHIKVLDVIVKCPSSQSDPDPLTFSINNATFDHISPARPGPFAADVSMNKPQGGVRISGETGPWSWNSIGNTPVSGSFAIPQADLAGFIGVRGLINAKGRFAGPLRHVICNGAAEVPEFQVSRSSHSVNLSTTFRATINGLNGDVTLESAQSRFNRTIIESQGFIKQDPQRSGKTASLRLSVEEGQIGDVLLLFTRAPQPAMLGTIDLRLNVEVPPGPPRFLQKLTLSGDFGVDRGRFTKSKTQAPINHLGESAAGLGREARNASDQIVLSEVAGHISAERGLAKLSGISFAMPGSRGVMSGTYDLLNQAVDLDGRLLTTGELSSAASGLKAIMLKIVTPFLTKHSVTVVGFTITGTAQHPRFGLDLLKKRGP